MKRFILPVMPNNEGIVRLDGNDYHYLVRVRRLKNGSCFDAVLPGGNEIQVCVLSTLDRILVGECLPPEESPGHGSVQIQKQRLAPVALFQALPKGQKMDIIVRQAAEAGVSLVIPFASEHSAVRIKNDESKHERWERIVREGRQQSGSSTETEVKTACDFDALFGYWESVKKRYLSPVGILLHHEPLAKGTFHRYLYSNPDFVVLAVGPEGGFSPWEVSRFLGAGFKPLLMGNTILRTETAAIYGIAAINIILQENETWTCKE